MCSLWSLYILEESDGLIVWSLSRYKGPFWDAPLCFMFSLLLNRTRFVPEHYYINEAISIPCLFSGFSSHQCRELTNVALGLLQGWSAGSGGIPEQMPKSDLIYVPCSLVIPGLGPKYSLQTLSTAYISLTWWWSSVDNRVRGYAESWTVSKNFNMKLDRIATFVVDLPSQDFNMAS